MSPQFHRTRRSSGEPAPATGPGRFLPARRNSVPEIAPCSSGANTAQRQQKSRPQRSGRYIWLRMVPPRGFEPLISALKGRRPRPLDDEGESYERRVPCARGRLPTHHNRWRPSQDNERAEAMLPRPEMLFGSGSWTRTNDLRVMSPTSYHCSIPRRLRACAPVEESRRESR